MDSLQRKLLVLRDRIETSASRAGRAAADVRLIGASKTRSAEEIRAAARAGLSDCGENYLDEALGKIEALNDSLTWHFIGRIQSNKTRQIANAFDWVHTVSRARIARRLNEQRARCNPLNVLIQVNLDRDPNKDGVDGEGAIELARYIAPLDHLRLRGLMTMLHPQTDPGAGYASVAQLARTIQRDPGVDGEAFDQLSMGMSGDFEAAIQAGATMIRVGTDLFGPRPTPPNDG